MSTDSATDVLPGVSPAKTMHVMDGGGDSQIRWNPDNAGEVEAARAHFTALRAKRYLGFRMSASGSKGTQLDSFDPDAERILMVPPSVGG